MTVFSALTPAAFIRAMDDRPAAPAPDRTTFTSSSFLPTIWQALIRPAVEMMAVPCWSSWKTGMSSRSCSWASISKHSGDLMSSRLMPPQVSPMFLTTVTNSSGSVVFTSTSKLSTSAKRLNRTDLPSITGLDAMWPRLPRPRMAVPLEMTATRLPLAV
ncbi:hypothetical protein D3C85_1127600 [compost metagenome]